MLRRVHFSRDERNDPLLLAKDAINEALFNRAVKARGLEAREAPDSGEDNNLEWIVDCPDRTTLHFLLEELIHYDLPCLLVDVPNGEAAWWERQDHLANHFQFDEPFAEKSDG